MSVVRRFLVAPSLVRLLRKERGGARITEGYFAPQAGRTSFVRLQGNNCFLVLVTGAEGATAEERTEVPRAHGDALLDVCAGKAIYERTAVSLAGNEALVDRYVRPAGLDLVSLVFEEAEAAKAFVPPVWFGAEVSTDAAYHGQAIALTGVPSAGEVPLSNAALEAVLDLIEPRFGSSRSTIPPWPPTPPAKPYTPPKPAEDAKPAEAPAPEPQAAPEALLAPIEPPKPEEAAEPPKAEEPRPDEPAPQPEPPKAEEPAEAPKAAAPEPAPQPEPPKTAEPEKPAEPEKAAEPEKPAEPEKTSRLAGACQGRGAQVRKAEARRAEARRGEGPGTRSGRLRRPIRRRAPAAGCPDRRRDREPVEGARRGDPQSAGAEQGRGRHRGVRALAGPPPPHAADLKPFTPNGSMEPASSREAGFFVPYSPAAGIGRHRAASPPARNRNAQASLASRPGTLAAGCRRARAPGMKGTPT